MCEDKGSRGWKPEATWQREVAGPLGRNGHGTAIKPSTIKGLHGEEGILYPQFLQPEEWFVDKATGGVILIGRVERSQSQNVERMRRSGERIRRTHKVFLHETCDAAISR